LKALHAELEKAAKPGTSNADAFFAVNERFHMRLLEIAKNRWRDQMVADLRKVMKLNRHNSLLKTGRIQESLLEHRAIMEALAVRDAAATVERMREHFANGLQAAA
jgi:DNA-binding GntR family transcriptional regulator